MKKVVIVEDEHLAAQELKRLIQEFRPTFEVVQVLESQEEIRSYFKDSPAVDLIFLDIELADGSSLDAVKSLDLKTPIIYCTAYPQFALEAFETNVVTYLLKPFSKEKLLQAIEKFESLSRGSAPVKEEVGFLLINSEYRSIKIEFTDIMFLESIDDYIKIHVNGGKIHSTLMSMKKMLEKLPEDKFVRIHRSYVVPLFRIEYVRGKSVSLGFKELPLGITHEEEFYKRYLRSGF